MKDEIKKIILDIAGNPSSGAIKDLSDTWASEIAKLVSSPSAKEEKKGASFTPAKETRETKPEETR